MNFKTLLSRIADRGQHVVDFLRDFSADSAEKRALDLFRASLDERLQKELDAFLLSAQLHLGETRWPTPHRLKLALISLAFVQTAADNPGKKVFIPVSFFNESGYDIRATLKELASHDDLSIRADHIRFVGSPERDRMLSVVRAIPGVPWRRGRKFPNDADSVHHKWIDAVREEAAKNGS